ncbi:hypothetical protein B0T22DRAFT_265030 [Podospora appendiculata]|uniref:BTB domain-containing protein n=1 Tax=Podospora appendiculata TaxID=314037 RepID=A0AAE0X321_9PEZI|nr:hypothetical protein B0T22DRAFT_265030 [Podospora appendiculata]
MDTSVADQDGDASDSSARLEFDIIDVVSDGDLILDVTFETSKETLQAAKRATKPRPGQQVNRAVLKPRVRLGFRVQLAVLKQHSRYFSNLLSDTRFAEAKSIEAAFERLSLQGVKPGEAERRDLPLVKIHEDDEASQSAGQETIFQDLLRILHGIKTTTKPVTMQYLATLAILSDRFDCKDPVSRWHNASLKYKWPATQTRLPREDGGPSITKAAEETLRQKILVAWLLNQPARLQTATRELITYGSRKWSASLDEVETSTAAWWDLPDDLEGEIQHRRDCVLNTIASVQRHFLQKYTSRARQCTRGYDSSASCDSYQLGEMVKFLVSRGLLFLADFSPSGSVDAAQDAFATVDINHIIAVLKECPSYQIDKNHTNCGLRTRVLPIFDYIKAMLHTQAVSINGTTWAKDRELSSWLAAEAAPDEQTRVFRFTRSIATDQRLRHEGLMAADRFAKALFTADEWNWTPED